MDFLSPPGMRFGVASRRWIPGLRPWVEKVAKQHRLTGHIERTDQMTCADTYLEPKSSQKLLTRNDARDKLSFSVVVGEPVSAVAVSETGLKRGVFGGKIRIGSKLFAETQHVVFPS